ncbi:outer membrane protein [Falsirhodobacter sp. alg1]|uniref:outer membrane protein n=1 Tax=Falsirhodobacter sp. alg1 TaxID=1472418 RepID=UPI0005EE1BBD|nr:outer membrane beta-barrel protein [Falsirhodobacter sp. alg1]
MFKTSYAFATAAVAAIASPALAGGPVVPVAEPVVAAPVAVVPAAPTFAGGYVGGGIGYAFGSDDGVGVRRANNTSFRNFTIGDVAPSGVEVNAHAGYRWQQPGSNFVYGVEGMISTGEVEDSIESGDYAAAAKMQYSVTLRGTLGYTVRPDTLLYGFAGYTAGRSEYTVVGPLGIIDETDDVDGYVLGFGAEKFINDKWSVRGEYEYSNYGSTDITSKNGAYYTKNTPEFNTIRVGVNYNF